MFDRLMAWLARHPNALPERMVRGGFLAAADVTWALHIGSVRQLERNLAHVLSWRDGTDPDRRTLRKLSRKGMRSYFTYFSEAMTVGARSKEQLLARIHGSGDGFEAIKHQAGSEGTGSAPIAMGHQGNWDYDGFWAQFDVAPVTTVAEKLANREMLDAFVSIREHLGMTIFLTGTPKLTERLEEALRTPHTLVPLLADRDLSRHGEFVNAFGSFIRVARGPAAIAFDTGTPLFVVNTYREKLSGERRRLARTPYGYVCEVSGPIDVERYRSMPREEAIRCICQDWVDIWARGIASHPEDWHMLQPIFLEDLDMERLKDVPEELRAQATMSR
ncbi:phosphatidylinositol mannoside acyltransferase [Bifidobacterium animalis]|uniref:phosphatidylinositol mannoside acyltransferase n=1 Tax=Bifidobacterium animalis TaxID=28025 RepID=UPI003F8E4AF5